MPFKEATFWWGTILGGTGIYFWVQGGDRMTAGIILTVIGVLMSGYAVIAHHWSQLPRLPMWFAAMVLTLSAVGYDIADRSKSGPIRWFYLTLLLIVTVAIGAGIKLYEKRQVDAEQTFGHDVGCDELYAETIFAWLREHVHAAGVFSAAGVAKSTNLPTEAINRGLELLRTKYKIVKKPLPAVDSWSYKAASSVHLNPQYKLVAVSPVARNLSEDSKALASLPVYWQDLRIELLHFVIGTSLDFSATTFFLNLSIMSDVDTGIKDIEVACAIGGQSYRLKPLNDLSEWVLRTEFNHRDYPYKSFEDRSVEDVSLWKDLRSAGLKSGLRKYGWIGVALVGMNPIKDMATRIGVIVTKPGQQQTNRFWFYGEPSKGQYPLVFDREFQRN
jgi:hypothetical protein